jgi:hypothetical protein
MPPGPKTGFSPGERVILRLSSECGVVICAWEDTDIGELDYYVAFFGERFPKDGKKPARMPYVLRYSATSLELAPSEVARSGARRATKAQSSRGPARGGTEKPKPGASPPRQRR